MMSNVDKREIVSLTYLVMITKAVIDAHAERGQRPYDEVIYCIKVKLSELLLIIYN